MTEVIPHKIKKDLRSFSLEELKNVIQGYGGKPFTAKQIQQWFWQKGVTNFEEMSNLSKSLRAQLAQDFDIKAIQEDKTQNSADGTIKARYKLHDGHFMESVLIPVPVDNRYTVCVSSQVGCSLTCSFCATGRMKRIRNLEPGEIFDQVFKVNQKSLAFFDHPLTNVVYMGMGEPLLAYKNVLESIRLLTSPEGLGMSAKRITVSTAGIAKMIRKLADDKVRFNLALSLHAADDTKRNEIMPINETNDLNSLMDALEYFYQETKNKISYEYIALRDFNDSIDDAKNLVKWCKRFPVKVNIIEYNPIEDGIFNRADYTKIDKFVNYLKRNDVMATVRRSRGKDIDAACGQLANKG